MKQIFLICGFLILLVQQSCKDNDLPPIENEEEIITDVRLIFNPTAGGNPLTFLASDPDGEGNEGIVPVTITLSANTTYQLFIKLENSITETNLTDEIEEEGVEHQFFFGFTNGLFMAPTGNGNIDSGSDQVNYIDEDDNGLPIGLITGWQTGDGGTGTLQIILKHQPDLKSGTTGVQDGATDLDLTWPIEIE